MIERVYIDGKFKDGERSFHIYCTVCDSLVIIHENTIKCANDHLNKCITKTAKMYSNPIRKNTKKGGRVALLSPDEIEKIYLAYKCKAENDFSNSDFPKAVIEYRNASNAIYYGAYGSDGYDSIFYTECNSWLEERMAASYSNLRKYKTADSLFGDFIGRYPFGDRYLTRRFDPGLISPRTARGSSLSESYAQVHSHL